MVQDVSRKFTDRSRLHVQTESINLSNHPMQTVDCPATICFVTSALDKRSGPTIHGWPRMSGSLVNGSRGRSTPGRLPALASVLSTGVFDKALNLLFACSRAFAPSEHARKSVWLESECGFYLQPSGLSISSEEVNTIRLTTSLRSIFFIVSWWIRSASLGIVFRT